MEAQFNQYFMYGIVVSYDWYKQWEEGTGRKFPVGIYGNVFCLFSGRDGHRVIIGRVLEKTDMNPYMGEKEPVVVPKLDVVDEVIIRNSVKQQFDLEGEFHYYFVTNYR